MAEGRISLDDWIAQATAALAGKDRQRHAIFQKEWVEGHLSNALLFPLEQKPGDWQGDFDWYWTVEDFIPPEQPREKPSPEPSGEKTTKPKAPANAAKKNKVAPDQAETVILNPDSPKDSQMDLELGDMETMEWIKK